MIGPRCSPKQEPDPLVASFSIKAEDAVRLTKGRLWADPAWPIQVEPTR